MKILAINTMLHAVLGSNCTEIIANFDALKKLQEEIENDLKTLAKHRKALLKTPEYIIMFLHLLKEQHQKEINDLINGQYVLVNRVFVFDLYSIPLRLISYIAFSEKKSLIL